MGGGSATTTSAGDQGPPKVSAQDLGCFTRVVNGSVSMFTFGAMIGALKATWAEQPLAIQKGQTLTAIRSTGSVMVNTGGLFAAVGAMYTGTSCLAKSMRGVDDFWNGVYGGFGAGLAMGLKHKKVGVAVGSGVAFAVASAAVDGSGEKIRGNGLFDDNATPGRIYFPYEKK
jgi:mitochondrial import inner membrane translocase subunit TIM22